MPVHGPITPFDAGIDALKELEHNGGCGAYAASIRVLEAAGRYAQNPRKETVADLLGEVIKNGKV